VQNILSSSLRSKIIKFKIYGNVTLPVVFYRCETWSHVEGGTLAAVFENRVLKKTFGPKKEEVTAEWRRLYNEELNDLYSSPNIIRVNKSRRIRWMEHVHLCGRREVLTGFWWENLKEIDHLEDPGINGSIILKYIFKKWNGGMD